MRYSKETIVSAIALALVALAWGTSYAIVKDALKDIGPFALMSLRFGLSTILLSAIFIKRLYKAKKEDLRQSSLIGIIMFVEFFALIMGIPYTTASKQSFIIGAYVLIVPFLAWAINRKRPSAKSIVSAVLATIGIALLTLNSSLQMNAGDLISMVSSLFLAGHMIAIEHFSKKIDPIVSTIMQFAVTAVLFLLLMGGFESFELHLSPKVFGVVVYLVVVTTVIPFAVQNIAQRYISATTTALILTLEAAFGGIFAVLLLKETMSLQMIIGALVVFIAIIAEVAKWDFLIKSKTEVLPK